MTTTFSTTAGSWAHTPSECTEIVHNKDDSSVLFFCKFPPPHTGQTIGTHIFAELLDDALDIRRMNTSLGFIKPEQFGWRWIQYHSAFVLHLLKQFWRLHEALKCSEVDTLYLVASPSPLGLLRNVMTIRVARPHVSSIVAHVHNGNYQKIFGRGNVFSWSASYVAENVDEFVFTSGMLSRRLELYVPKSKRAVVHNTVDNEVQCIKQEVAGKVQQRKERDTFRVLYLSNMIPSKGYLDVAKAVVQFQKTATLSMQVDFIGDWPDNQNRTFFLEKIEEWGLQNVATVHGRVTDRARIKQFLLEADAFVLPTYYPNEAQPITIIEAMNAGTPIVSTRHASIPEYVLNGENGYLVDKRAPEQIASALLSLMDPDQWTKLAQGARATYEEKFSPEAVRQQMIGVMRDGGKSSA